MGTVAAGSCNVALTTAGARTLTATYAGDTNFATSSDTEPHQVNMAATTTAITSQSDTITAIGEVFTVFYSVAVTAPGAGTPTGTVTVSDGVNSCMGTVAAGQCNIALTTVGLRTLTATYGGNANFSGSTSAGAPHTVTPTTAASVSVSGRLQTQAGYGVGKAVVLLVAPNGETRQALTNPFGFYRFDDVSVGDIYILSVRHKVYQFNPQAILVSEDIENLNLTAAN